MWLFLTYLHYRYSDLIPYMFQGCIACASIPQHCSEVFGTFPEKMKPVKSYLGVDL